MTKADLGKGYIHVYTGDGKGKTTAALGLALRAAGHGLRSFIMHFMKGNLEYGELTAQKYLPGLIIVLQGGRETFVSKDNPDAEDIRLAQQAFDSCKQAMASGEYDIVVLDEINVAVDFGLIPCEEVLELMRGKPDGMELVLTGRYADPRIIEAADLVTEMRLVKHYYDSGIAARLGIER